ncbi:MAG: TIM44-like domain-containing protein [Mariprofundales bacterium]
MIRFSMLILSAIMIIAVWPSDNADARRFGGGSSFGSHHRSFSPNHSQRSSHTASRPAAGKHRAANARPRSGFMGAIAGLAMGGLLGAMLFGGAFDGVNMFDILLIGAIGLGLLWWFRRKAQQVGSQQQGAFATAEAAGTESNHNYFDPNASDEGMASGSSTTSEPATKPQIDPATFLDASRAIFVRMQAAWDKQDIEDIRRFCLPEMVTHIETQINAEQRNVTEVVTLEANLLDSWIESGRDWAAVDFTAMMKEQTLAADGSLQEESNEQVKEIWTFCHDSNSSDPTWFVAGISQTNEE